MSLLTEEARRIITTVQKDTPTSIADSRSLIAIALALVAIAEALEKTESETKNE